MRYSRAALLLLVGLIASTSSMRASAADPILSMIPRTRDADRSVGMIIESRCKGEDGRCVGMIIESVCGSCSQERHVGMIIESRCGGRTVPLVVNGPLEFIYELLSK